MTNEFIFSLLVTIFSLSFSLGIEDVPNAPVLLNIKCNERDATIDWQPKGDNGAPISHYIIEYNTTFTPETWTDISQYVPATDVTFKVPLTPWANFTFRVIAVNKIGKSLPSRHSYVCTTYPDVPYKNPEDVRGEGEQPDNLVITWTPMPEIEHNGPNFRYRVYWKEDIDGVPYHSHDILDWKLNRYVVENQPTFRQYRIKVQAINEIGEANVAPQEVIGYSGEDTPLEAPTNFTLMKIIGPKVALISWNPVSAESVRGHLGGYKIKTWSGDDSTNHNEIQVPRSVNKALVEGLDPSTKNYAQISVYNKKYNGPSGKTLSFEMPEA